jgi:hypothetical protein
MKKQLAAAIGMTLTLGVGQALAQVNESTAGMAADAAPTCADLNWTADVLANNPDIAQSCQAVYEKDGKLYAKATIEVVRVRGNRVTFRPLHTDGTKGDSRSMTVDSDWRAEIGGRKYRASDLMRGQQLNVYLPEDRFALAVADDDSPEELEMVVVEEEVVEMPTTASPLFLIGAAGAAFVALGGLLGGLRRRLS